MSQPEFHRRYKACPEELRFELIEGVVYMASPMRLPHATHDAELTTAITLYKAATPGVEAAANVTVILAPTGEVQPDHMVRVLPEHGGRTRTTVGKYVAGGPELVVEVAHSSVAIDLHSKKDEYRRSGVLEYVVVCLDEAEVWWFDLPADRRLTLPDDAVLRSRVFPGLWIDTAALFRRDTTRLVAVLNEGLATPEHAEFVRSLEPPKPRERGTRRGGATKSGRRKKPTGGRTRRKNS